MLGELRNWKDGTTLVQKTHEASLQSINEVRNIKSSKSMVMNQTLLD